MKLPKTAGSLFLEHVPVEIKCMTPYEIDREHAKKAVEFAIKEVMSEQKKSVDFDVVESSENRSASNMEDDEDDCWDDDYRPQSKKTKKMPEHPLSKEEVTSFFVDLRKNIVFDMVM